MAAFPGKLDLAQDIARFNTLEERRWVVTVPGMLRNNGWARLSEQLYP